MRSLHRADLHKKFYVTSFHFVYTAKGEAHRPYLLRVIGSKLVQSLNPPETLIRLPLYYTQLYFLIARAGLPPTAVTVYNLCTSWCVYMQTLHMHVLMHNMEVTLFNLCTVV